VVQGQAMQSNQSLLAYQPQRQSMKYSGCDLMDIAPKRPITPVEDFSSDEEDIMKAPAVQQVVAPMAIKRPIAVRPQVVRPIPKRATEEFYSRAFEEGIAAQDVHKAVMESHEWHRKWTLQEEQGHTQPHGDACEADVPNHYAYQAAMDRAAGAKNPSPEDSEMDQRKRVRTRDSSPISSSLRSSSSQEENRVSVVMTRGPVVKRRAQQSIAIQRPIAIAVQPEPVLKNQPIQRPVALRVARPVAVRPPTAAYTAAEQIPKHIIRTMVRSDSMSSTSSILSSLTLPSVAGGSYSHNQTMEARPQVHIVEDDVPFTIPLVITRPSPVKLQDHTIVAARDGILQALAIAGGDVLSSQFKGALEILQGHFARLQLDTRSADSPVATEGLWLTLTKPTFFGCLGENDSGDPMYTLGRMSFDMFSPTSLVCSLQGNFNSVEQVDDDTRASMLESVPKSLRDEVQAGDSVLRTYT
jgi:hypothetical protein